MDSFNEAWDVICEYCKQHITQIAYNTWISKIKPVNMDFAEGKAILMVPAEFHRQTLLRGYMQLLNDAFASVPIRAVVDVLSHCVGREEEACAILDIDALQGIGIVADPELVKVGQQSVVGTSAP